VLQQLPGEGHASWAVARDDTIAWVDRGFDQLAGIHGLPDLPDRVVGRPLIEFVAGSRPRALQQRLLARARASSDPLVLHYRCDAPHERRIGLLELTGQPGGGVIFATTFVECTGRSRQPLLDPAVPRGDRVIRECAWCNKFHAGGAWCEVEEAAEMVAGTPGAPLPRVEHGVCDTCEMLLAGRPPGAAQPL
jgi:hypothetical protein